MRLLVIFSVAGLASSSAAATPITPTPKPAECPATSRFEASQRGGAGLFSRLGDLPAADAYKAVYGHDGRCEVPIIVRYNIGAPEPSNPGR